MEPALFNYLKRFHQRLTETQAPIQETSPVVVDIVAKLLVGGYVSARISRETSTADGKSEIEVAVIKSITAAGTALLSRKSS